MILFFALGKAIKRTTPPVASLARVLDSRIVNASRYRANTCVQRGAGWNAPDCPFVLLHYLYPLLRFLCWTARPKGVEVAGTPLKGRKEQRVALKMFVTLSSPG